MNRKFVKENKTLVKRVSWLIIKIVVNHKEKAQ